MADQRTVEGSKERAAERGAPDLGLVEAARDADRSLGNPAVVERLVQGFCHRVVEILSWRRTGQIDADEMVEQLRGECERVGGQFVGAGPEGGAYLPVAGWNTRHALGMTIMVLLGGERVVRSGASNAGAALFEWLAEQLGDAYLSMAQEDAEAPDVDAVGERAQAAIVSVIDTLVSPAGRE